jgi:coenzyme F420-reducing hydrogenase delta subunit
LMAQMLRAKYPRHVRIVRIVAVAKFQFSLV